MIRRVTSLVFCWLIFTSPVVADPVVVNIGGNSNKSVAASGGTLSITAAAPIPSGSTIVICAASSEGTIANVSFSDTTGDTFTQSNTPPFGPSFNGTDGRLYVYYAGNTSLINGGTITYTNNNSSTAATVAMTAFYVKNVKRATPFKSSGFDNSNGGSSASPTVTSSGNTTSHNMTSACLGVKGPTTDTFTQDSNFSTITKFGTSGTAPNILIVGGYKLASTSASTVTYAPTITSQNWDVGINEWIVGPSCQQLTLLGAGC